MNTQKKTNRQIVLASRPTGTPTVENFRLESVALAEPAEGQLLLRTLYLSLDPYMRSRMNEGSSYAKAIELNQTMEGGTVSRILVSNHPDFQKGDLVLGHTGWQEYAIANGAGLTRLDAELAQPSYALGVLGMPGFTAYVGLLTIGEPQAGETVVVAAASGAVGAVVGQIARIKGCYVVGIAGGADKCRYVLDTLGFDECLDRNDTDFANKLATACPKGIDVYYENVGGAVFDAVLPLLNVAARVPVCGLIAHYNETDLPAAPNHLPLLMRTLLSKRIKMQGFIISDHYQAEFARFIQEMRQWLRDGKIKVREDIVDGLENAPQAFIGLLAGKNFGKLVVRVTKEPSGPLPIVCQ